MAPGVTYEQKCGKQNKSDRNIFFLGTFFSHPGGGQGTPQFFFQIFYISKHSRGVPRDAWDPWGAPGVNKTTNNTVRGRGSARAFVIPVGPGGARSNTHEAAVSLSRTTLWDKFVQVS